MRVLRLFLINFLVFGLLLSSVYGGLWLWVKNQSSSDPAIVETFSNGFIENDSVVGFHGGADLVTRAIKKIDQTTVYDVEYRFDEFHRRQGPVSSRLANRYLIFLGGSQLFGQGVEAEQTLAFQIGKKFPDSRVYNYAVPGWGPNNNLALVESDRLAKEITEKSGLVLYFFTASYTGRLIGNTDFFRWSDGSHPFYEMRDGKLVRDGSFVSAHPWYVRGQRWFAQSPIHKVFKINWPPLYSPSALQKLCASFVQIQQGVEKNLPGAQFYVVLWLNMHNQEGAISQCLENHKIPFISLTDKVPNRDELVLHPLDAHLNAEGHKRFTKELAKQLFSRGLLPENLEP